MKYSYSWLKEYVPQIPEPKKLVELLTMRAFEVESCEKINDDYVLDIKVLPNRAFDCLSHIGIAREIAAISSFKFSQLRSNCRERSDRSEVSSFKFSEEKNLKIKNLLEVEVQDKKLCPRYSARVVVDVKVGDSPKWMQERLVACGLRPINNIVDITNYAMLEYGQPLHAFDFDKIANNKLIGSELNANKKIIVRLAEKGERIIILDGEERELNENILVIADEQYPIAIAGVKGGKKAEIDNKTTKIILESANFEPISVRKSAKSLNLRTDASIRFENGVDVNLTKEALNRAAALIKELCSGKIASGIADELSAKPKKISTAVAHSHIESLLGVEIKQKDVFDIFRRLDLPTKTIKKKTDIFYEVFVPNRRNDLNTSEDLIEEIGRLYGYENIPAKMPTSILIPAIKNEELINEEKARNIMVGAGYSEVYNYSLISQEQKDVFGLQGVIGPRYPLSQDQKYLRPTLIVRLLENIEGNSRYFNDVRIFEIGKIFQIKEGDIGEKRMIAGVLYKKDARTEDLFREIKGIVDLFLEKIGVPNSKYYEIEKDGKIITKQPDRAAMFYPKRAQVKIGDNEIGFVGEINKGFLWANKAFLKNETIPVVIFELDFDAINKLIEEGIEYKAPSKYPAIERDLSILAPRETRVDSVLSIIENAGGSLIINVNLEDMYEGEHLGDDIKSLTFGLVFQSWEKTLTDTEVNKIVEKIIEAVEGEGWEIRS